MASVFNQADANRLFRDLERFGGKPAFIDAAGRATSYSALADLADRQMLRIDSGRCLIGIEANRNDLLSLAAYIGAARAGHVAIIAPDGALSPGSRIRETFRPSYVINASGGELHWEKCAGADRPPPMHRDLSVLLPTSGSTGSPKLVRLSHRNLLSNAGSIASYLEISPADRACMALPWFYSYGLSVINSHLYSGAAVLLSDESVTDRAFWDFFRRHEASSFAGVPYTFELLEQAGFLEMKLPGLRYFTQSGGKLGADKVALFADYAERHDKRFFVMYGQTEASPRIAYMPPSEIKRYPGCVGQAIPGGQIKIVDERGREIDEPGKAGEIVYRGPNVMMGYAEGPEDLARGPGLTELHTGDLAVRNREGFLEIVGRSERFSKILGLRIALDDVEEILKREGILSAAAGNDAVIAIAIEKTGRSEQVRNFLAKRFKLPLSALSVIEVEEIPRLRSGKIDYPAILKSGLEQATAASVHGKVALSREIAGILGIEIENLDKKDSFVTLGGDSLNYIKVSLLLEERLGHCPPGWEYTPLKKLEALAPVRSSWIQRIDMDVLIRAAAVTLVVVHHVTNARITGGAMVLLIAAGYNFARFQVPKLLTGGSLKSLWPLLSRIVPLYFAVVTVYFFMKRTFFLPTYLLIRNFTHGAFEGVNRGLTTWWFIESYIWLVLVFSLIFKVGYVRRAASGNPWGVALALLGASLGLRGVGEIFGNLKIFYKITPFMVAYFFTIGWCLFAGKTPRQRMLTTALALSSLFVFRTSDIRTFLFIAASFLLLAWIPSVPLDRWTGKAISTVSLSSLYIYMTHDFLIMAARKAMGGQITLILFPVIIAGCLLVGVFSRWAMDRQWLKAGRFPSLEESG